ncbi:hypothetical protein VNO78_31944 [Psophocarpus tetragonolobus]|uniref:Uncharacterized protein n=1 Tax=Psophocarpus tetragonolobus TaxID=3891 RepID=A0AAN9RYS4_PSOTE
MESRGYKDCGCPNVIAGYKMQGKTGNVPGQGAGYLAIRGTVNLKLPVTAFVYKVQTPTISRKVKATVS